MLFRVVGIELAHGSWTLFLRPADGVFDVVVLSADAGNTESEWCVVTRRSAGGEG